MVERRASLAIMVAVLAVVAGAATCGLATPGEGITVEAVAVEGLGFEIFLGLMAFAGAMLTPGDPRRRLGLGRGRLSLTQNLSLIAGTIAASAALDGVLDVTGLKQHSAMSEFEQLVFGASGYTLLLSLLAFVIAPAICEELLCRGLLQRGLVRRFGAGGGIALASLAFGALHLDPIHAAAAGCLGAYLGIACHLAGSLRTAVACHFANNLLALLSAVYSAEPGGGGAAAVWLGGPASIAVLWWVGRRAGGPSGDGSCVARNAGDSPRGE
jgi:membrane protease YdiL (CAAX protease family)